MSSLLAGLGIGLAIAASPGPIFFLTVRWTLEGGWLRGLAAGLGVATADATWAALAAFGVAAAASLVAGERRWLELAGGIALLLVGAASALRRPAAASAGARVSAGRLAGTYAAMLGLTLANPATIVSFAAVFAGIGLRAPSPALLVLGVMAGSALWWVLLSWLVAAFRRRLDVAARPLGVVAGGLVALFGLAAILTALWNSA